MFHDELCQEKLLNVIIAVMIAFYRCMANNNKLIIIILYHVSFSKVLFSYLQNGADEIKAEKVRCYL